VTVLTSPNKADIKFVHASAMAVATPRSPAGVWMLAALLAARLDALGAPPAPLEVAGVFVTAASAWSALDRAGGRLTLRYAAVVGAAPALDVRVVLQGSACARAPGSWRVGLLVDGRDAAAEPCAACDCRFRAAVGHGAHTLAARVTDAQGHPVAYRQLLVRLVRDGPRHRGADFAPDEAPRAAALLREYAALHRRIVDPADSGVAKRFLVVRSSHGLSNTQIEEVTGLLMAIVTRRALILDFSNDTYTGQRPVMEYEWPLDIWMDAMSPFLAEESDVLEMPRIENEEYGKYGELLACADWNGSLPADVYLANTLFGFPTAYLNPHHAPWINTNFGPYVFPLLHAFLHRPAHSVRRIAEPAQALLRNVSCSVGLQIRWHHLRAYLDAWGYNHPHRTVSKIVGCATELCPMDATTVVFVASDFKFIRRVVIELLASQPRRRALDTARYREGGKTALYREVGGAWGVTGRVGGHTGPHVCSLTTAYGATRISLNPKP